jgi:hypothetical protein
MAGSGNARVIRSVRGEVRNVFDLGTAQRRADRHDYRAETPDAACGKTCRHLVDAFVKLFIGDGHQLIRHGLGIARVRDSVAKQRH